MWHPFLVLSTRLLGPRRCPTWSALVIPENDGQCLTVRRGPGLRPGVVARIRARWVRAGFRDVLPRCPEHCPGGLHQRVLAVRLFTCGINVFTAPTWMMGLTVDLRGRTPAFLLTVAMTICDPVAAWAQP